MTTIKLTVSELEDLALEGEYTTDGGVEIRVVKNGEWVSGGKYEDKTVIFTDGERHYRGTISRSGSYFSHWTFGSEWDNGQAELTEVAEVPITTTAWRPVLERGVHVYETEYSSEGSYCISNAEYERLLSDPQAGPMTIISPAIRTAIGWYPVEQTKEAA